MDEKTKKVLSDNDIQIKEMLIEFDDPAGKGRMCYQQKLLRGAGLDNLELPFNLGEFNTDDISVKLLESNGGIGVVDTLEHLQYLVLNPKDDDNKKAEYDAWIKKERVLSRLLGEEIFKQAEDGKNFPTLTVSDVTERDMFGYAPIDESRLTNEDTGGIWTWTGLRKFCFQVDDLTIDDAPDITISAALYWHRIDAEDIPVILETDSTNPPRVMEGSLKEDSLNTYIVYINTNRLGEIIEDSAPNQDKSVRPKLSGRFELHIACKSFKKVYSFPVQLVVNDTRIRHNGDGEPMNHLIADNSTVSIDFGTSSTCAAVKGENDQIRLFTLSGPEKRTEPSDNKYENPTNLMIYSWDEVYRQWQAANRNCPFLVTQREGRHDKSTDYDSGYTVEDVFRNVDDLKGRRRMAAIIRELKTIPYILSQSNEGRKFTPFNDIDRKVVHITDKCGGRNEDVTHFNPIAFYGYLLGRAINNPTEGKIYNKYCITYPVAFNQKLRDTIKKALEYGILRALPRHIQEAVNEEDGPFVTVEMNYAESEACVGAFVGKQLKVERGGTTSKLFAVFDLGGGTMDTSYGMYRAITDEKERFEVGGADYAIHIFGIGGNGNVGGEKLIHKLAYRIYLKNREAMETNKIKFVLPVKEKRPDGFENLISPAGDEIADANVNIIKEKIARPLFVSTCDVDNKINDIIKDKNIAISTTECKLKLRNNENKDVEVTLKVEGVDDFLKNEIDSIVKGFMTEMDDSFQNNDKLIRDKSGVPYEHKNVHIFLGGNASKQRYVTFCLEHYFPDNKEKIQRIGETVGADEFESEEYKITGKTAVAFGQLELDRYYVDRSTIQRSVSDDEESDIPPFPYYVGYINQDEFVPVLKKNDTSREWRKANFIGKKDNKTKLCYTASPGYDDKNNLTNLEVKVKAPDKLKRMLYIRVHETDSNCIEYRLVGLDEEPLATETTNPALVIHLKDPNLL